MRIYGISSPVAAEMYFNNSFVGDVATFFNAAVARLRGAKTRRPQTPRGVSRADTKHQSLLDRLDHWFWRQQQKAQESYLAGARDRFDLERRIDEIDRGTVERYY
jgi:hypothetical protein